MGSSPRDTGADRSDKQQVKPRHERALLRRSGTGGKEGGGDGDYRSMSLAMVWSCMLLVPS